LAAGDSIYAGWLRVLNMAEAKLGTTVSIFITRLHFGIMNLMKVDPK